MALVVVSLVEIPASCSFFWPVLNADDPMQPNGHRHRLSKLENKNAKHAPDPDQELPFSIERAVLKGGRKRKKKDCL